MKEKLMKVLTCASIFFVLLLVQILLGMLGIGLIRYLNFEEGSVDVFLCLYFGLCFLVDLKISNKLLFKEEK